MGKYLNTKLGPHFLILYHYNTDWSNWPYSSNCYEFSLLYYGTSVFSLWEAPFFYACIMTPLLYANLTPNEPVFHYSLHPMTENSAKIKTNCQFSAEKVNFRWNLTKITPNDALFLEVYTKKAPFFECQTHWPLFSILHQMPLVFVLRKAHTRHFHIRVPPGV